MIKQQTQLPWPPSGPDLLTVGYSTGDEREAIPFEAQMDSIETVEINGEQLLPIMEILEQIKTLQEDAAETKQIQSERWAESREQTTYALNGLGEMRTAMDSGHREAKTTNTKFHCFHRWLILLAVATSVGLASYIVQMIHKQDKLAADVLERWESQAVNLEELGTRMDQARVNQYHFRMRVSDLLGRKPFRGATSEQ